MAKLIVSLEGSVIRDYPLEKERVTIGRKPHNDIQIENLAVSGEHACIVTILNDSFLEDLGSTNGTLVNGNAIKKHILQNNDVVEIGKYRLKYVSDAPMAGRTTVDEFEKTMVLRAPGLARVASSRSDSTPSGGPRTMGVGRPPPTPRPSPRGLTIPGGQDPAMTGPQTTQGRDTTTTGQGTSPGGGMVVTSGPSTSSGGMDPIASAPPAAARPREATTASGATTSGPTTSSNIKAAAVPPPAEVVPPASKPTTAGPAATSPGGARTTAGEPSVIGAIQILSGSGAGKELDLVKNLTTLGKPGVQVAVITRRPQGYFITHVEGATSPEVNGRALDAQARLLQDHDVIELAGVKMEFFLKK